MPFVSPELGLGTIYEHKYIPLTVAGQQSLIIYQKGGSVKLILNISETHLLLTRFYHSFVDSWHFRGEYTIS
jgi:hypothetical protein